MKTTTLVIGLDGASFEMINEWLDTGELPNIQQIIDLGVSQDLKSCLPPVTSPNWMCYATGLNPGKLGVFWWDIVDRGKKTIRNTCDRGQYDGPSFWEMLDGRKGIINLPTSYPTSEGDGVYIAGGPSAPETGYCHPPEYENILNSKFSYKVHPKYISLLSKDKPDSKCVDEIYSLIDSRFDLALDLLESEDFEFIHVTIFYLNALQHFFWKHDCVKEAWKLIDDRMGEIMEQDKFNNLFIMSDHGTSQIHTVFRINSWLIQNGYLSTTQQSGLSDLFYSLGLTRERIRPTLAKLGVEWWVRNIIPEHLQNKLPDQDGTVERSGKAERIDWEQSIAVASGQGPVYLLKNKDERVRDELITELEKIRKPDGEPIFKNIFKNEEIYCGTHTKKGPDIILDQANGIHIEGRLGSDKIFSKPNRWKAENKNDGIFVAYGEDIKNSNLNNLNQPISILDLAPTVLHIHNKSIPLMMDGRVLKEIFKPSSNTRDRKVKYVSLESKNFDSSLDHNEETRKRLSQLGYLD